jgi:GT2 family glycosyltransferase
MIVRGLSHLARLARVAPGVVRVAWAALPAPARSALAPLVHPVALGRRGDGFVLSVPKDLAPRRVDVVGRAPHAGAEVGVIDVLGARGYRVLSLAPGADPAELGRREHVVDAIYLADPSDPAHRREAVSRLAWRTIGDVPAHGAPRHAAVERAFPSVSIVVVTYANARLLADCLSAIERNTPWPETEVLVVDNGSREDTRAVLEAAARRDPRVVPIVMGRNAGFARAANEGLGRARGDYVVLLNDDTVVGPGWLSRLVAHLESDPELALVCPVTNEIGNEAKIPVGYTSFEDMERFALARAFEHPGARLDTALVPLFCAAARRSTLEAVGHLDERYEIGLFEDDDLSLSLRRRGHKLGIALDAFVHHVGQASFSRLPDAEYLALWHANRRRFEAKWGTRWVPPAKSPVTSGA